MIRRRTYIFEISRTADKTHEFKNHRDMDVTVEVKARSICEARVKAYQLAEITDRGEYGFDIKDELTYIEE